VNPACATTRQAIYAESRMAWRIANNIPKPVYRAGKVGSEMKQLQPHDVVSYGWDQTRAFPFYEWDFSRKWSLKGGRNTHAKIGRHHGCGGRRLLPPRQRSAREDAAEMTKEEFCERFKAKIMAALPIFDETD
jgi:hypothetical protein